MAKPPLRAIPSGEETDELINPRVGDTEPIEAASSG